MVNVHRYNAVLQTRLQPLVYEGKSTELLNLLNSLSNGEFRTASYILAESLLPKLSSSEVFMSLFYDIVPQKPKAFLGTFLKAACKLYAEGVLQINDKRWELFSQTCSDIDCRKILESLLPLVADIEEATRLLILFARSNDLRMYSLMYAATDVSYYLLFRSLQAEEDNTQLIRQQYFSLLKKNNKRAYNLASIIRHYFDLRDIPGQLSLRIKPYELSRLNMTFESFKKFLNN